MRHQLRVVLYAAAMCLFAFSLGGWSHSKSHPRSTRRGQDKTIEKAPTRGREPLEVNVFKGDKPARFGEKFSPDAEWLRDITFRLRNKSGKTITYVMIALDFPETLATGSMMQHQITLGAQPGLPSPPAAPFTLEPGESHVISLTLEYDAIKRLIELRQPPMADISKVTFILDSVGYEDGTLYSGGELYRRNPDAGSRRKWLKIADELAAPTNN